MKKIFNFATTPPLDTSLAELRQGDRAVLQELLLPEAAAQRLMCMGFVPGVEVTVGPSGPGGDPRVYHVDGTDVALRERLIPQVSSWLRQRAPRA